MERDPADDEEEPEEEEECTLAFYAMGYRKQQQEEVVVVAATVHALNGVVLEHAMATRMCEVLLVAPHPLSEAQWVALAAASLEPQMHLQVQELVSVEQGAACADRLIHSRGAQLGAWYDAHDTDPLVRLGTRQEYIIASLCAEGYLDTYRIASAGFMHPLDDRVWCMPPVALARMRAEEREATLTLRKLCHEGGRLQYMQQQQQRPQRVGPGPGTTGVTGSPDIHSDGGQHQHHQHQHQPHALIIFVMPMMHPNTTTSADDDSSSSSDEGEGASPSSSQQQQQPQPHVWFIMEQPRGPPPPQLQPGAQFIITEEEEEGARDARFMELMHELTLQRERIDALRGVLARQAELARAPAASDAAAATPTTGSTSSSSTTTTTTTTRKRPRFTAS